MAIVNWDLTTYEGTTDELFMLLYDTAGAWVNGAGGVAMIESGGGGHFTADTVIDAADMHAIVQILSVNKVESTLYAGSLSVGLIPAVSGITVA